ncbi:glycoprotein [Wenzhou Myotis laniger tupavirus 1]|uniref:glycoprotein n=1 Tax=Wenzhou Myotis laniger tupavirus 1 TaxID=2929005 RepID=UPI002481F239|nr:glycoprotein [Wenzhou Myotis laniger tupavirus 1]UOX72923.1 glycoprotein [Wenzhou Myotis laniger tupavirus 1]
MSSLIVFLLLVLMASAKDMGPKIIAPVTEPKNWKKAELRDFSCSSGWEWNHRGQYIQFDASVLKRWEQIEIRGYLCMKNVWKTTCQTNMFFSKKVTHQIRHEPVDVGACNYQLEDLEHGNYQEEQYPDPTCAWMSEISTEKSFIKLTPHNIGYDLYTNTLLSPSFPAGSCKIRSFCPTIYKSVIWIPTQAVPAQTKAHMFDSAVVKITVRENKIKKDSWAFGSLVTPTTIDGACELTLAGRKGLLLSNGFWFEKDTGNHIIYQNKQVVSQNHAWSTLIEDLNILQCDRSREVGMPKADFVIQKSEAMVTDIIYYHLCLESLQKIREGTKISRMDLARLTPTVPGIGNVYQLTNDGVRVGTTKYEVISWIPKVGLHSMLGLTLVPGPAHESTPVQWNDWKKTSDGFWNGPNGIIKNGTELIHPNLLTLGAAVDTLLISEHLLQLAPHPIIHKLSDFTGKSNITEIDGRVTAHFEHPTFHIWEGVQWFSSKFDKFLMGGGIVITLIIGCLIIWIFSRCFRKNDQHPYYN